MYKFDTVLEKSVDLIKKEQDVLNPSFLDQNNPIDHAKMRWGMKKINMALEKLSNYSSKQVYISWLAK